MLMRRPRPCRSDDVYNARVNVLCLLATDRVEGLFETLGVDARRKNKGRYEGPCPVHGGDNPGGLNLWSEGRTARGVWCCRTHRCEDHFGHSLLGLVRGILSHDRLGWFEAGHARVSHREARDYLCTFLGRTFETITVEAIEVRRQAVDRDMQLFSAVTGEASPRYCSPTDYAAQLELPAAYYLGRDFTAATLRSFGVGTIVRPPPWPLLEGWDPRLLVGRVAVPVHDESGAKIIGVTTRSLLAACDRCALHHAGPCPPEWQSNYFKRWLHLGQWQPGREVYNLHRARPAALQHRCLVVCEGPGDVWRLTEAGIPGAVAVFGSHLTYDHRVKLQACLPTNLVVLTDADLTGDAFWEAHREEIRRFADPHRIRPERAGGESAESPQKGARDVASFTTEEVRRVLRPRIEAYYKAASQEG